MNESPSKSELPAASRWYAEGLRFECTQCGNCCTGAPGFVWVNPEEIGRLAVRLTDGDVDRFEDLYLKKIGARYSLKEFPNGDCVLFDNESRKCTVYEDRPTQCRTWPFWHSNLKSPDQWRETRQECPGCDQGQLYSLDQIEVRRKAVKV